MIKFLRYEIVIPTVDFDDFLDEHATPVSLPYAADNRDNNSTFYTYGHAVKFTNDSKEYISYMYVNETTDLWNIFFYSLTSEQAYLYIPDFPPPLSSPFNTTDFRFGVVMPDESNTKLNIWLHNSPWPTVLGVYGFYKLTCYLEYNNFDPTDVYVDTYPVLADNLDVVYAVVFDHESNKLFVNSNSGKIYSVQGDDFSEPTVYLNTADSWILGGIAKGAYIWHLGQGGTHLVRREVANLGTTVTFNSSPSIPIDANYAGVDDGASFTLEGDTLYIAHAGSTLLDVVDISDPNDPVKLTAKTLSSAMAIAYDDTVDQYYAPRLIFLKDASGTKHFLMFEQDNFKIVTA